MRGRQMITTRAHRHQASPNLLVCLRSRSVPLGTVEIRCLQHRLPGRYRPFPPNFALFANWLSVPHAGVGTPPHANFIVNYPIFFMRPFIPCECYVHGEFGVLPMFVSLVLVFPPSKVCIATLREGGGGAALFCPLRAAICSVWRALWLVCRLLDPTNSEPREIVTAAAVGLHEFNWRLHLKVAMHTFS